MPRKELPPHLLKQYQQHAPQIAKVFLESVQDVKDSVVVADLIAAIESGDSARVMAALNLKNEFFDRFIDSIFSTFTGAGRTLIDGIPGKELGIRFDSRSRTAETWIATRSSDLITEIVSSQRDAVRVVLEAGMQAGRGPRSTALDIVGRINPASKRRQGGILGLTENQSGYVLRARQQLSSGDPMQLRAYLGRELRDRRFDGIIRKAIKAEKPVSVADIDKIAGRYSDRLLKWRGDAIARTETIAALNAGRDEAISQVIDKGEVPERSVTKRWRATGGPRTRDTHAEMDGQEVQRNEPFSSPSGAALMYPGDTSLGAPAEEIIHCLCYAEFRIDYLGLING